MKKLFERVPTFAIVLMFAILTCLIGLAMAPVVVTSMTGNGDNPTILTTTRDGPTNPGQTPEATAVYYNNTHAIGDSASIPSLVTAPGVHPALFYCDTEKPPYHQRL